MSTVVVLLIEYELHRTDKTLSHSHLYSHVSGHVSSQRNKGQLLIACVYVLTDIGLLSQRMRAPTHL